MPNDSLCVLPWFSSAFSSCACGFFEAGSSSSLSSFFDLAGARFFPRDNPEREKFLLFNTVLYQNLVIALIQDVSEVWMRINVVIVWFTFMDYSNEENWMEEMRSTYLLLLAQLSLVVSFPVRFRPRFQIHPHSDLAYYRVYLLNEKWFKIAININTQFILLWIND